MTLPVTDYGEPWGYKRTDQGLVITLQLDGEPINIAWIASEPEENIHLAQRIVACVNACKGINPDAVLEIIRQLTHANAVFQVLNISTTTNLQVSITKALAKAYEDE